MVTIDHLSRIMAQTSVRQHYRWSYQGALMRPEDIWDATGLMPLTLFHAKTLLHRFRFHGDLIPELEIEPCRSGLFGYRATLDEAMVTPDTIVLASGLMRHATLDLIQTIQDVPVHGIHNAVRDDRERGTTVTWIQAEALAARVIAINSDADGRLDFEQIRFHATPPSAPRTNLMQGVR